MARSASLLAVTASTAGAAAAASQCQSVSGAAAVTHFFSFTLCSLFSLARIVNERAAVSGETELGSGHALTPRGDLFIPQSYMGVDHSLGVCRCCPLLKYSLYRVILSRASRVVSSAQCLSRANGKAKRIPIQCQGIWAGNWLTDDEQGEQKIKCQALMGKVNAMPSGKVGLTQNHQNQLHFQVWLLHDY